MWFQASTEGLGMYSLQIRGGLTASHMASSYFFFFFFFLKFKEKIYWRSEKQFLKDWLFQKTVATQGIASIRLKRALDTNTKTVNKPPLFHNLSEGEVPKERHGWLAKGKLFTVSTNEKWKGHRWASGSGYTHWVGPLALGSEHLSWSINTYSKVRRVKGRGPPAFKSSFVN